MASSVDRVAAVTFLALLVGGCVSTQQKAARIQLNDARIRAAEHSTRVTRAGSAVIVVATTLVRRGNRTAFVVRLRNTSPRLISDLPISVGLLAGRRRRPFLNAGTSAVGTDGYFGSHLPPIAAGAALDWVYVTDRPLPRRAQPLVAVGDHPAIAPPTGSSLPAIRATVLRLNAGRVTVAVRNLTAIPQYQLAVYATGARRGRTVVAGQVTVAVLGAGASTHLSLTLVGRYGTPLQIQAPATTFP